MLKGAAPAALPGEGGGRLGICLFPGQSDQPPASMLVSEAQLEFSSSVQTPWGNSGLGGAEGRKGV